MPVMKPCWKKKAGRLKQGGWPAVSQPRKNSTRATRSLIHEESGLRDGYATFSQILGTWFFSIAVNIASSSELITTRPCIARPRSASEALTILSSRLKRPISCSSTICSESSSPLSLSVKVVSPASARSIRRGTSSMSFFASSCTVSSGEPPPPPPPLDSVVWMPVMVESRASLSCLSKVILAFACSPKMPTESTYGSPST
mmetsp:Transcript_37243/g.84356  ORF Transcript_37243/g.84356 Transcript_37243/m.84356 type:complete len:201 (+) Transcript_37243:645-1247(+)